MPLSDHIYKDNLKHFAEEYLKFLEDKDFGNIGKVQYEEISLYLIMKYKKFSSLNNDYELTEYLGMSEDTIHRKMSSSISRYFTKDMQDSKYWNSLIEEFSTGGMIEIHDRSKGKLKLQFNSPIVKWFVSQLCTRARYQVDSTSSNKQIIISVDALSEVMQQLETRCNSITNELIPLLVDQIKNDNKLKSGLKEVLEEKQDDEPFFKYFASKLTKTSEKVLYTEVIKKALELGTQNIENLNI